MFDLKFQSHRSNSKCWKKKIYFKSFYWIRTVHYNHVYNYHNYNYAPRNASRISLNDCRV